VPQLRSLTAWAPLAALVAASALVRFLSAVDVAVPWIAPDEIVYAELGRTLYADGILGILGERTAFYSLVYPALVGLPLSLSNVDLGYTLLKALQAVVMSLAAVPVYLWGRELMSRWWALLAAALTLAVPGLAYTGLVMTEVAFYPIMALAAWAAARALAEPTLERQALLLGAIVLACATRLQAAVLVPALVTALGLKALFERSGRVIRGFVPTLAALGVLALAWSAWQLRGGGSWSQLFAAYQAAGESSYGVGRVLEFVAYHAGGLALMAAVFPVCALVLLALEAGRGRERSNEVRAFLALAVSLTAWLVVEVGVFASEHVGRLAERDLLAALPPLFLALALWLARGGPRPRVATIAVALGTAALALSLPLDDFVVEEGLQDSFTLIPLFRLHGAREALLYGGVAGAVVLFALLPRRLLFLLPALAALWLVFASAFASDEIVDRSRLTEAKLLGPEPRWVDAAAPGGGVAYLYDGDPYWNAVWEHVFWNRDIDRVYDLPGAKVPGPMPQRFVDLRDDGRLVADDGKAFPRYVVAASTFTFEGDRLAETRQEGTFQEGLVLWRLEGAPRIATSRAGIRPDGDIFGQARLVAYGCDQGAFELRLIAKDSRKVMLRLDGRTVQTLTFDDPSQTWGGAFAAPENPDGSCTFEIVSDGLLGSTLVEYRPRS
jgi:hypothetical protein